MAKDKKHKKDGKSAKKGGSKAISNLKALTENPLVADIVASALVATASALKDSKRARALASDAGDEIGRLSKAGAQSGSALWEMALQIGKRSLEALQGEAEAEEPQKTKSSAPAKKAKSSTTAKKPKAGTTRKKAKGSSAAKKPKKKTASRRGDD